MIDESNPKIRVKNVVQMFFMSAACLIILLFVFVLIYTINQRHARNTGLDETQAVDLSAWNFGKNGNDYLEAGWQFYPGRLLTPPDFYENSPNTDSSLPRYDSSIFPHYSNVTITTSGWEDLGAAAVWSSKSVTPPETKAFGYGTYRIVIKVPEGETSLAVDFPEINQAAQIWVNGNLLKSFGKVTTDRNGYVGEEASATLKLMPTYTGLIEIVIDCSNYSSPYGGIACSPAIGTDTQIYSLNTISKMWISSVFTLLVLVIITGFYISFTFESKKKYYYFILIISMSIAYEICDRSFNPMPGTWNSLLQVTFFLLMALLAALYFSSIYPRDLSFSLDRLKNWDIHIIFFLVTIFLMAFWMRPDFLFSPASIWIYSTFAALISLYNLVRVIFMTLRHPEYGIFHVFSAIMALCIFLTMQVPSQPIYFIPLHSIGIVLMIFATAIYFTVRYVSAYNRVSRFTLELEQAVQDKTRNIAKVNAELLQANKKLIENEEARKKMMSNVSHDLRTPIAAIRGYIELLLNAGSKMTDETRETYIKNMHTRCMQMEQLIEDLMQLTRLESGGSSLTMQPLSLSEIIDSLYELYDAECRNSGRSISMSLPDNDSLSVMGDPNNLIRVLDNLIVNAMRYTNDNGRIEIRAFRETSADESEKVHIIVKDDGCGIPESEIAYVFDRFYRASNSASRKNGSGLGLAIVKSIVEKHGGKVWVESREKEGSSFHVQFPALS